MFLSIYFAVVVFGYPLKEPNALSSFSFGFSTVFQFRKNGKAGTEGCNNCHDYCTTNLHLVHHTFGHLWHNHSSSSLEHRFYSMDTDISLHSTLIRYFIAFFSRLKRHEKGSWSSPRCFFMYWCLLDKIGAQLSTSLLLKFIIFAKLKF